MIQTASHGVLPGGRRRADAPECSGTVGIEQLLKEGAMRKMLFPEERDALEAPEGELV